MPPKLALLGLEEFQVLALARIASRRACFPPEVVRTIVSEYLYDNDSVYRAQIDEIYRVEELALSEGLQTARRGINGSKPASLIG
ncbi:MAG: hypothetical protein AAF191_08935 [Verrucomicrobiota bacterium]